MLKNFLNKILVLLNNKNLDHNKKTKLKNIIKKLLKKNALDITEKDLNLEKYFEYKYLKYKLKYLNLKYKNI